MSNREGDFFITERRRHHHCSSGGVCQSNQSNTDHIHHHQSHAYGHISTRLLLLLPLFGHLFASLFLHSPFNSITSASILCSPSSLIVSSIWLLTTVPGVFATTQDPLGSAGSVRNGPRFVVEPPAKVHFLNDTGTVITCKVTGAQPVRVWWSLSDGSPVTDVHALRHVRPNGDLVISPFQSSMFRQDIHATIYRCMGSNTVGTIRSRDIEVRAVIQQPYSVQVYGEYAIAGNTGHMKCQIPAFVRDYVKVTAWLKGDSIVATSLSSKDSRFVILSNGDLLIRNTSRHDSGYYRCQTRHELSQETVLSSIEGHFIVNDVYSGVSPRVSALSPVRAYLGASAELVCVTKAWPQPTVRWFQASESGLITPIRPSANVHLYDSVLVIDQVTESHSGNWICAANNSLGEERAYVELHLIRVPVVKLVPDFLVADMSSSAMFVCNVTHGSALSILWVKDGLPIISANAGSASASSSVTSIGYTGSEGRIRLIEPHILNIRSVSRDDAGCYQCIVQAEEETNQATGELKLGDSPPIFLETFQEGQIFEEGSQISLRCSATATPLPQIRWFLDEQPIDGYSPRRLSMADYVKHSGHVVSFANITNAKVIDGGEYRCTASNNAGQVSYTARVNVAGPATLRPMWTSSDSKQDSSSSSYPYTVSVVSSRSVTLRCPVVAYPIESLQWQHRSTTLPSNHRQKVDSILAGIGGKLHIANVHRDNDQGEYTCTVKGSDGKSVRGSVQMVVRVAPLIDSQLISPKTIANQGMKVKLMCSVLEGDPPMRIKWFRAEEVTSPVASNHALGISVQEDDDYSLLTFRSVSIRDMGNWTCRAWNDVESVNRTTYLVVNVAPSWRTEPKNVYVVLGKSVSVDCSAEGHPSPRILWKKSVSNQVGSDDSFDTPTEESNQPSEYRELLSSYRRQIYSNGTLSIQEVDKSDSGFYMCQVSNTIGAGLSKVIQLVVQSPPFFSTKFLSKSVSKSELALLECEAQGDPVLHIRWYKDRALIQTSVSAHANDSGGINTLFDKRYTIKQDVISAQKVISFLEIVSVQREDSTIYTCVARNNFGNDNTSVQLIVQEVPDPPQSVEILEVTSRSAQFQWKSPYSGNSALTRFYIHYRKLNCSYVSKPLDDSFWKEVSTQSGNELRFILKGLTPNCYYETKMSSENMIGRSDHTTNVLTLKTLEEVPGGPPLDVQVETTSSTSVKIKWKPPLRELHFGKIRGYYIGYKVAGMDDPFLYKNVDVVNEEYPHPASGGIDSNPFQVSYITNLKRKTTYQIILQAYNNVGPGPRSDEIQVSTFDSQPPTSPLLEVVSTTYDGILVKWDSSFQQEDVEDKEYILYFREDKQPSEWHQKRIYAKVNQFVLNKDNSQTRIKCGTKYHLYMTATNSLGTGEPSETVIARTKGEPPLAPSKNDFIRVNSTAAVLALKSWQPRGCSIHAFTIQYKPIHQKQWIPLVEYYDSSDYFYVSHLNPNRDYMVLISAHSDAGITRQEYTFHTSNNSAVLRMGASASDHYNRIEAANLPGSNSSLAFRNLTVLLPVMISLLVLIVILGTLFGCMRRQHVNHVVNGIDGNGHGDLCHEHLNSCLHNGKEAMMLENGTAAHRTECYPLSEFRAAAANNNCVSLNNSCDSKSNLLNGQLTNGDLSRAQLSNTLQHSSPRHLLNYQPQEMLQTNHFATLNCKMKLMSSDNSYYSSPQRKLLTSVVQQNPSNRSDHEYAEPVASLLNRARVDRLIEDSSQIVNPDSNHCQLINTEPSQQQQVFEMTIDSQPANEAYSVVNKPKPNLPYL